MNIHEHQAKEILKEFGAPVSNGVVILSPNEIDEKISQLKSKEFVLKAQIHAGGRGKAGGVKLIKNFKELKKEAENMMGKILITHQTGPEGKEVKRLYIEEASEIEKEFYLSCLVDRESSKIAFISSIEGGVDIEKVALETPEKIITTKVELKNEIGWSENYKPRLFESGTSYMYGTNIDWVGRLVEKISGMNLEDYFRENITGPLEMNSTWFNVPEELESLVVTSSYRNSETGELVKNEYQKRGVTSNYNAGGGLSSSPSDYGKFLACMLNKGELNGIKILNEETFDLMNSPQLNDFKTIHRYVPVGNVDTKPRGDKDTFFDGHDNWTLAWAYEENSINRPIGTAYWAGFFNTYFTIDFDNEFALVYMTQILPFNDMHSYNLFTSFERLIYDNLKK